MDTHSDGEQKRCAGCRTVKPLTEFHRNRGRKDGRQDRCKVCRRLDALIQQSSPPAARVALRPYAENWGEGGRRCTACQEWKVWAEYHRHRGGYRGYSPRCKACVKTGRRSSVRVNSRSTRRVWGERSGMPRANGMGQPHMQEGNTTTVLHLQGCAVCGDQQDRMAAGDGPALCGRCFIAAQVVERAGALERLLTYLETQREST